MKRKYVKRLVKTSEMVDFFGMAAIDINKHMAKGKRFDYIYIVLNRDNLTTKEKKDYVYSTSMSEQMKDNIWERFNGDFWFDYCKYYPINLEFEIIQEGGSI